MRRLQPRICRLATCLLLVSLTGCGGGGAAGTGGVTPPPPPTPQFRIVTNAPESVVVGSQVSFTATAIDPDGSAVAIALTVPLPAIACAPATGAGSATAQVSWDVADDAPATCHLVFVARRADGAIVRSLVTIEVVGAAGRNGTLTCDVTGDGIPDVISVSRAASQDGQPDVGALYVWAGGSTVNANPTATLLPTATATATHARLNLGVNGIVCCDLNGDGTMDIVAQSAPDETPSMGQSPRMPSTNIEGLYVWLGGPTLAGATPRTARLHGHPGDGFDLFTKPGLICRDVTGDGIVDLIGGQIGTSNPSGGAVLVWAGDAAIQGDRAPTATLRPVPNTGITSFSLSATNGIYCTDLNNDGVRDVVVASGSARLDRSGHVALFLGGATLLGERVPDAELLHPADASDRFGDELIRFCDVTGDGFREILVAVPSADLGGIDDVGALYVYPGSSQPTGAIAPLATLVIPNASDDDQLTDGTDGPAFLCCDVTGDGLPDVVTRSSHVDLDVANQGAGFVWAGGPTLVGTPLPTATLVADNPMDGDLLSRDGLHCADVTGDGQLDVVLSSEALNDNTGGIAVFAGGSSWAGARVTPTASLSVAGSGPGALWSRSTVRCCDVTGDGIADVVTASDDAGLAVPSPGGAGALAMWAGGAAMAGARTETALMQHTSPNTNDRLGKRWSCVDVTGDGVLDIVGMSFAFDAAAVDSGAMFVWFGASDLAGIPVANVILAVPTAQPGDMLGDTDVNLRGNVIFGDVTADGVLDIVASATSADVGGSTDAGALYVWSGADIATQSGLRAPNGTLIDTRPGNHGDAGLGATADWGFGLFDMTGDGVLDIFAGVPGFSPTGGPTETGAVFLWAGGATPQGTPKILSNPDAGASDRLTSIELPSQN